MAIDASLASDRPPSLRAWIRDHDDKWLFVVIYLGLAVGLSVFVGLFWLLVVAGLHFVFEIVRQAYYREGARDVILHALWEVKLDVGLVLLALTLVLYIDVVLGLLGLQSAARAAAVTRAGARVGPRAAAWERNIRTFLLTVDEMVRVTYAGVVLRKKRRQGRRTHEDASADAAEAAAARDGAAPGDGAHVEDAVPEGFDEQSREDPARDAVVRAKSAEDREAVPAGIVAAHEEAGADRVRSSPDDRPPQDDQTASAAPFSLDPDPEGEDGSLPPPPPPEPAAAGAVPPADGATHKTEEMPADAPAPERWMARPAWRRRWGIADRIGVALVALSLLLIVAAPLLTPHGWGSAAAALLAELRPFQS